MTTCTCRRCEELTECLLVTFIEQHGFDYETTLPLCEDCYDMYRQLYITDIIYDDTSYITDRAYPIHNADGWLVQEDEAPIELDEDPSPPDTTTIETDIDNPI